MKVYSISDLHLDINNTKPMSVFGPVWHNYLEDIVNDWNSKVQAEDVVLLAGDFSWAMKLEEVESDLHWLDTLNGIKIMVRGNHDYWWKSPKAIRELLPKNVYVLQNDAIKIGEYIFCGNRGWQVPEGQYNTEEDKKIYAREVIRLELSLQNAKKLQTNNEKIIYVTHYPPFNLKREPSEYTKLLENYGVYKVVFGHLHGYINPKMFFNEINGIKYYLTSCDAVKNKLVDID